MSETFRPSTLGEILDRTAQIYRRNFWLFAGVAALPIGTVFAITAIGGALFGAAAVAFRTTNLAGPAAIAFVVLIVLIAVPVYIAAAVFSSAGLTEAAASTYRGEKITIRGAFTSVGPRFWRYLWFIILQGIVVALIPAAIAGAVDRSSDLFAWNDCWSGHCRRRRRGISCRYRCGCGGGRHLSGSCWAIRSASPCVSWRKSRHGIRSSADGV